MIGENLKNSKKNNLLQAKETFKATSIFPPKCVEPDVSGMMYVKNTEKKTYQPKNTI